MYEIQGKKRSALTQGELADLESMCADYWDKSRSMESETIRDLEKHLWLANGAAATASIGFVQAASQPVPLAQYIGAFLFVGGIFSLMLMKFFSATVSSRDRYRFELARKRFYSEEVTDEIFDGVRDRVFGWLKDVYLVLQWMAGILFLLGLVLTLIGVRGAV